MPAPSQETLLLRGQTDLFLLPAQAVAHAKNGHSNGKQATGSVFRDDVDLVTCFRTLATGRGVKMHGVLMQAEMPGPVGWSALTPGVRPTGVLCKFEPVGDQHQGTLVLAAAAALSKTKALAGGEETSTISAIAIKVGLPSELPADVRANHSVLRALRAHQLRKFISVFPGPVTIDGRPLPKVSDMDVAQDGIVFSVRRDNSHYLALPGRDRQELAGFIRDFNKKSLAAARIDEGESVEGLRARVERAATTWFARQDAKVSRAMDSSRRALAVLDSKSRAPKAA
jgi:hypothetical protein